MSEIRVTERKRPDLVVLIALYRFIKAALALMGLLFVGLFVVIVLFEAVGQDAVIAMVALSLLGLFFLTLAAVNIAAGVGLLALKNWARWLAVVLGVLALPNLPIGTVVGMVTIWYLFTPEAKAAFGVE